MFNITENGLEEIEDSPANDIINTVREVKFKGKCHECEKWGHKAIDYRSQ